MPLDPLTRIEYAGFEPPFLTMEGSSPVPGSGAKVSRRQVPWARCFFITQFDSPRHRNVDGREKAGKCTTRHPAQGDGWFQ